MNRNRTPDFYDPAFLADRYPALGRIRKLVSKVFTSRSVAGLGPVIAGPSRELVDRCRQMRTFDLLADYAQPYSVAVIAEVLGVPRADTRHLQMFARWVLEPGVEIAGQPLAVGDQVAMLFGSAQRDPRRFACPDRFDVARGDPAHVGFGGGIHFCVGPPWPATSWRSPWPTWRPPSRTWSWTASPSTTPRS